MRWLYERKFVSLARQAKATATASERTKTFVLQSNGALSPTGLRQTESSGSAFRVNKNQSYRGRLTTRTSPILLTRQLGTVVRRKTDNPNQRTTDKSVYSETRFDLTTLIICPAVAVLPMACKLQGVCIGIAKEWIVTICYIGIVFIIP